MLRQAGFQAAADPTFNPKRASVVVPKPKVTGEEDDGLVYTPDDKTSLNPLGVAPDKNVVCKCERVTEAEIVDGSLEVVLELRTEDVERAVGAGEQALRALVTGGFRVQHEGAPVRLTWVGVERRGPSTVCYFEFKLQSRAESYLLHVPILTKLEHAQLNTVNIKRGRQRKTRRFRRGVGPKPLW